MIDEIIKQLFWQIAKMHLRQCECSEQFNDEICTVYTTFSGGYKAHFLFCAERTMMQRIAENIAEEPLTDLDDVKEYMKEFINVICGHIVASIFGKTKMAARFQCPEFSEGYFAPQSDDDTVVKTFFINECAENAMLLYDKVLSMAS